MPIPAAIDADELKALLHKRYPEATLAPASPPLWAYTDTAFNEDMVFWSNSATQRYLSQRGLQNIIEGHSTPYMNDVDARFAARADNAELIDAIAASADLPKATAAKALDAFTTAVTDALKQGDSVSLVGFGTFAVKERAAREGRNP